jgi:type II secretory pathway pseudopilin PulG
MQRASQIAWGAFFARGSNPTRERGRSLPSPALGVGVRPRLAFTLVELLVALGLLLIVMAMGLWLVPSVTDEQQATRAATQLQQWIEVAKQRAARDHAPRGIRLLQGTVTPTSVTELVYTEQPPDFFLGINANNPAIVSRAICIAASPPNYTIQFQMLNTNTDVVATGTNAILPRNLTGNGGINPVQAGDHLYLVSQVFTVVSTTANKAVVTSNFNLPVGFETTQYRFIRQPRQINDDLLQMAQNMIIDCSARNVSGGIYNLNKYITTATGTTTATPYIDIMFSPDGRVLGPLAALDKIILWVRDVTATDGTGDPALVCIYPRTGLIGGYAVDLGYFASPQTSSTPYTFTTTGRR